jgi:hypothetical protein
LRHRGKKKVTNIVFSDAGKAFFGSVIAVLLAIFLPVLMKATGNGVVVPDAAAVEAEVAPAQLPDAAPVE